MATYHTSGHSPQQGKGQEEQQARPLSTFSLSTATGRIGVVVVALTLALIVTPFILQSAPTAAPTAENVTTAETWPTAPPSYSAPVAPPSGPLRALPTPEPLPQPAWHEMSHLTVIEFMQTAVVDVQRTAELAWFGDLVTDRILLKATGEVQMGIDLGQVQDVEIDGTSIRLTVPKPEILSVELLPERSQIFARQQNIFLSNYTGLETEALEMGRRQLRAEVMATPSTLALAEEYGRLQLSEFLRKLGYETIEITYSEGMVLP